MNEMETSDMTDEITRRIEQTNFADISDDYKKFVDKFKPKHTTDDCYTPPNIYAAVLAWVKSHYSLGEDVPIIRPFYPGGDYEHHDYPTGCVVVDNPPFSILAKITKFYNRHQIRYFLFGPALTIFNSNYEQNNYIITAANITYANGAVVSTSFVTNLGGYIIEAAPDLRDIIRALDNENRKAKTKELSKYSYPSAVITAAAINYLAIHHTPFNVRREDVVFIRAMDAQKTSGKALFGGGFLLSERAAAERAAAERAAAERAAAERAAAERAAAHVLELSEREKALQKMIGRYSADIGTVRTV